MRAWLKQIVERTDTRAGRAFDLCIQALIVLSLVVAMPCGMLASALSEARRLELAEGPGGGGDDSVQLGAAEAGRN